MDKFTFNLDHVVIVVDKLEPAIQQFRDLGFTVSLGGNNGPTHNALIPFQDGTYIELISIRSGVTRGVFWFLYRTKLVFMLKPFVSALSFRFFCWLGGPTGIRDWCVKTEQLDSLVDSLRTHNIEMSAVQKFTRVKPNQEIAKWFLVAPREQRLPFLIQDISEAAIRIPSGKAAIHGNQCTGISRLLLSEEIYLPVAEEIAAFDSQANVSVNLSQHKKVQLTGKLLDQLGIELAGLESKEKVLEMPHNANPIIR